jgi:hypothetical protein
VRRAPPALLALGLAAGFLTPARAQTPPAVPEATRWIDLCLKVQGARALAEAQSIEVDESEVEPGLGPVETRSIAMRDGRFYVSTSTRSQGTLLRGYDGRVAWQANGALGTGFISPSERASIREGVTVLVGLDAAKDFPIRRFVGYADELGAARIQLEMSPKSGPNQLWTLSRDTALVARIEHAPTRYGRDCTVEYSDYRRAGGLTAPFAISVASGPNKVFLRRTKIEVDGAIDPALFTPPAGLVGEAGFVTALIHRHLTHEGALDAMGSTTSKVVHERQENPAAGTSEEITLYVLQGAPNRVLEVRKTKGMGTSAVGFDGREGWMSSEIEGNRTLERDEIIALLRGATLRGDSDMAERYPLRRYLGPRMIDGRQTYAVLFSGLYHRSAVFYFDPETYRVVRIGSAKLGNDENNIEATLDFADFRRVQGIEFPFRVTTSNAAFRTVTVVDSIELNVPVPKSTFARQDVAPEK